MPAPSIVITQRPKSADNGAAPSCKGEEQACPSHLPGFDSIWLWGTSLEFMAASHKPDVQRWKEHLGAALSCKQTSKGQGLNEQLSSCKMCCTSSVIEVILLMCFMDFPAELLHASSLRGQVAEHETALQALDAKEAEDDESEPQSGTLFHTFCTSRD